MTTKLLGAPIKRLEDRRFLTGQGQFVDDIHRPGMLHAAVLRSQYAHARIRKVDISKAQALPGVHLVLTANDLGPAGGPLPLLIPHPALTAPALSARWRAMKCATLARPSPSWWQEIAISRRTRWN